MRQRLNEVSSMDLFLPRTSSGAICAKAKEYMELKTRESSDTSAIKKIVDVRSGSLVGNEESTLVNKTKKRKCLSSSGLVVQIENEKFLKNQKSTAASLLDVVAEHIEDGPTDEAILRTMNYSDFRKFGGVSSATTRSMHSKEASTVGLHDLSSSLSLYRSELQTNVGSCNETQDIYEMIAADTSSTNNCSTVDFSFDIMSHDHIENHCVANPFTTQTHQATIDTRSLKSQQGGGDVLNQINHHSARHKSQSSHHTLYELLNNNERHVRKLTQCSLNKIKSEITFLEALLANM